MQIVLLSLDGFPVRKLDPRRTPALAALAREGAAAPPGVTGLPSSTYVGHASLLTGAAIAVHGVHAPPRPPEGPLMRRIACPSLLDRAAAHGLATAAVVGDPILVDVCRLDTATTCWPPTGELPPDVETCAYGYATDRETLPRILSALDGGAGLVFAHLNEPDTAGHLHGPESAEADACYRAADAAVCAIVDALRPRWAETLLVVVSDHDMVERAPGDPIELSRTVIAATIPDGGAAWLYPAPDVPPGAALCEALATPGVAAVELVAGALVAVAEPGRVFAAPDLPERGVHGGTDATATVAIAAGGLRSGRPLLDRLARSRPHLTWWAHELGIVLEREAGADGLAGRRAS